MTIARNRRMTMTGAQLLQDLRIDLEASLEQLPPESTDRQRRVRELEDRSLWSGRLRRVA
jgi:hypothetical protein